VAAAGPSAEGVYGGTLTGGNSGHFQMLVLENDEYWALYGTQTVSQFIVAGFLRGSGVSNRGSYSSSNGRDFGFNPVRAASATASYNASAKTIAGMLTEAAGSVSLSGGPIAGSPYDYNTPARLSVLAGSWSMSALTGETIAVSVAASGAITASTSLGCSFTGTVAPRPSGKNVFNVTLNFGAKPCVLAGQSASGIALAYPLSNGKTQLLLAGTNADRSLGTAAFGVR
jgi:hypothetical protein